MGRRKHHRANERGGWSVEVLNAMPAFALPISACSAPNHSRMRTMQANDRDHRAGGSRPRVSDSCYSMSGSSTRVNSAYSKQTRDPLSIATRATTGQPRHHVLPVHQFTRRHLDAESARRSLRLAYSGGYRGWDTTSNVPNHIFRPYPPSQCS